MAAGKKLLARVDKDVAEGILTSTDSRALPIVRIRLVRSEDSSVVDTSEILRHAAADAQDGQGQKGLRMHSES